MDEQSTLADKVVRDLKRKILRNELAVGERLPPERVLAEQFGVSRITIRDAISRLAHIGFVQTLPQSGTFVANFRRDASLDLLVDIIASGEEVDSYLLTEFMEIRRVFESYSTGRAVIRMRDKDREKLKEMVASLTSAINEPDRMVDMDYEIHTFLMDLAGNSVMRIFFQTFRPVYHVYLRTFYSNPQNASGIFPFYERLCRAAELRDERIAAFVMGELLDYAEQATIMLLENTSRVKLVP